MLQGAAYPLVECRLAPRNLEVIQTDTCELFTRVAHGHACGIVELDKAQGLDIDEDDARARLADQRTVDLFTLGQCRRRIAPFANDRAERQDGLGHLTQDARARLQALQPVENGRRSPIVGQ